MRSSEIVIPVSVLQIVENYIGEGDAKRSYIEEME